MHLVLFQEELKLRLNLSLVKLLDDGEFRGRRLAVADPQRVDRLHVRNAQEDDASI